MGKYTIEIYSKARKELQLHDKSGNQSAIRKINQIFLELSDTPYEGTGNPEPLKYQMSGYWSRRINKKGRIIYKVYENMVVLLVVSAIGHYGDKYTILVLFIRIDKAKFADLQGLLLPFELKNPPKIINQKATLNRVTFWFDV